MTHYVVGDQNEVFFWRSFVVARIAKDEGMELPEGFPETSQLVECVKDLAQPLGKRTHAAFYLRSLATADAVDALSQGTRGIVRVYTSNDVVTPTVLIWRAR